MSRLKDYIEKLKAASEEGQTQALLQIVNRHQAQLIDVNQLQLLAGRNAKGDILGEYRSAAYAEFKNRLNPEPGLGVWDLRLSGTLYDSMFVEADGFPVTINASDSKADKFRDASPFGLDTKSKDDFREEIKPEIEEYYRSLFQL
jgi:hypothetical protein